MTTSNRNFYDPTKKGEHVGVPKRLTTVSSMSASHTNFETLPNEVKLRENFVPYLKERDHMSNLLGSYKSSHSMLENAIEAINFD